MEKNNIFGMMGGSADSANISVRTNQNLSQLSPYLSVDPGYLSQQPEFIFPEGRSTHNRARFELAFSQVGASCLLGASLGGATGLYAGLRDTALSGHTGKLRRTQLLNYITKQGASRANNLGTLAMMYSGFGAILQLVRSDAEDDLNTLAAGAATGLLYKSTAGLRSCALGGAAGLAIAAAYCLVTSGGKVKSAPW